MICITVEYEELLVCQTVNLKRISNWSIDQAPYRSPWTCALNIDGWLRAFPGSISIRMRSRSRFSMSIEIQLSLSSGVADKLFRWSRVDKKEFIFIDAEYLADNAICNPLSCIHFIDHCMVWLFIKYNFKWQLQRVVQVKVQLLRCLTIWQIKRAVSGKLQFIHRLGIWFNFSVRISQCTKGRFYLFKSATIFILPPGHHKINWCAMAT